MVEVETGHCSVERTDSLKTIADSVPVLWNGPFSVLRWHTVADQEFVTPPVAAAAAKQVFARPRSQVALAHATVVIREARFRRRYAAVVSARIRGRGTDLQRNARPMPAGADL